MFFTSNIPDSTYDIIFGDAFHNFAVPYHLTTLEFNDLVARYLRPGGLYIMNLIDRFPESDFLAAYLRTIRRSFDNVYLLADNPLAGTSVRTTFVVVSSDQPIDFAALPNLTLLGLGRPSTFYLFPDDRLEAVISRDDFLLTDDYVPVDNLLAPLISPRLPQPQSSFTPAFASCSAMRSLFLSISRDITTAK